MPNFNYAPDVKVFKVKKNKYIRLMPKIFLICLFFGVFIIISNNVLSVATAGNFSIWQIIKSNDFSVNDKNYYLISFGEFDELEKAQILSSQVTLLGGAGYVMEINKKFVVVASAYENNNDAENVLMGINTENVVAKIKTIYFNAIKFDIENISQSNKNIVKDSLNYINNLFTNLYKTTIQLEKKEITSIASASFINQYKSEIKVLLSKIGLVIAEENTNNINNLIEIQNTLISLENSLDTTINKLLLASSPAVDIKYGLIEVLDICYKLTKKIV